MEPVLSHLNFCCNFAQTAVKENPMFYLEMLKKTVSMASAGRNIWRLCTQELELSVADKVGMIFQGMIAIAHCADVGASLVAKHGDFIHANTIALGTGVTAAVTSAAQSSTEACISNTDWNIEKISKLVTTAIQCGTSCITRTTQTQPHLSDEQRLLLTTLTRSLDTACFVWACRHNAMEGVTHIDECARNAINSVLNTADFIWTFRHPVMERAAHIEECTKNALSSVLDTVCFVWAYRHTVMEKAAHIEECTRNAIEAVFLNRQTA